MKLKFILVILFFLGSLWIFFSLGLSIDMSFFPGLQNTPIYKSTIKSTYNLMFPTGLIVVVLLAAVAFIIPFFVDYSESTNKDYLFVEILIIFLLFIFFIWIFYFVIPWGLMYYNLIPEILKYISTLPIGGLFILYGITFGGSFAISYLFYRWFYLFYYRW